MYIELHCRSAFSFLEGASVPEELAEVCAQHQMPAIGLLDRDGVYGSPRFHLAAKKLKIKAHIGAEITSLVGGTGTPNLPRLPLLCASREGYQNLCRLITRTKLRAPKYPVKPPHRRTATDEDRLIQSQATASLADLAEHSGGLICLTGGNEGPLAQALQTGGMQIGRQLLEQLIALYGRGNVYAPLPSRTGSTEPSMY